MKNFTKEEWQMIYEIVTEKSNIGMESKKATRFYELKQKLENLTKHNIRTTTEEYTPFTERFISKQKVKDAVHKWATSIAKKKILKELVIE